MSGIWYLKTGASMCVVSYCTLPPPLLPIKIMKQTLIAKQQNYVFYGYNPEVQAAWHVKRTRHVNPCRNLTLYFSKIHLIFPPISAPDLPKCTLAMHRKHETVIKFL
jgi:hypothetical protein